MAGTQSVALGSLANAAGDLSVAIGTETTTRAGISGQGAVAVGHHITDVGADSTVVGYQAQAKGTTSTAMGSGADGGSRIGSSDNVAIGDDAKVRDDLATIDLFGVVLVGRQATSQSVKSTVVGHSADVGKGAGNSIAIGADAQVADNFSDAIVMGRSAAATAASQLVVGSPSAPIRNVYLGGGVSSSAPLSCKHNQTDASGTNVSTPDWEFNAGRSTGTGTGGEVLVQTTGAGSSGTTPNGLQRRLAIGENVRIGAGSKPGTGTMGAVFGQGTPLASMASNTAGLYAGDVSGTARMHAIDEAGVAGPIVTSASAHAGGKIVVASASGQLSDLTPGAAYVVTNITTLRDLDGSAATLSMLANVLGTLIADLQAKGIVG